MFGRGGGYGVQENSGGECGVDGGSQGDGVWSENDTRLGVGLKMAVKFKVIRNMMFYENNAFLN